MKFTFVYDKIKYDFRVIFLRKMSVTKLEGYRMREWLDNAVFYEIYPQSFQDTNGDGIGDFRGIIKRLDYIKELGCNAIWMNPCFASPFGDAGYDISDYYQVAPRYGTNEDLKELFEEVHKKGMHILLDLVMGHTSVDHPWFKESMKPEKNEFTDRYVWTDSIWETPERAQTLRGISDRDGSCIVNFFSHQPALNYGYYEIDRPWQQPVDAPGPQASLEELKNVMRFWLTMGCDGFRVDMAHSMVKNDPESKGTIAFWKKVMAFLDEEFSDAVMVSEWGEPDKALEGGFHMDFLLHFGPSHYNDLCRCEKPFFSSEGKGNIKEFIDYYLNIYDKAGEKGLICIPSGNHDMDRMARTLSQEECKVAFAFLMSVPGAPFIYYGDEIGMRYVEGLHSVEGGYGRTGSRSPMQWDKGVNAGFSSAPAEKLYVPIDSDKNRPCVSEQMEDMTSLWHEVQKLIAIRKAHPALGNRSKINNIYAKEKTYPLAYIRECAQEKIAVVINPGKEAVTVDLGEAFAGADLTKPVYSIGGEITALANGQWQIPGASAQFYMMK